MQPPPASSAAAPAAAPPAPHQESRDGGGAGTGDAPPKQVAVAMERLSRAGRLIADIRLGADRLLEALFLASDSPHHSNRTIQLILKEESSMRQHFQDLRTLGRQLEDSGVLSGSLKSRGNSWGLHMPLVCPDGAVVAYAWKRQLAGQAGASAVDRTRLALKAFTDQKRRFFPHLDYEPFGQACDDEYRVAKKHCSSQGWVTSRMNKLREQRTLPEILTNLENVVPDVKIYKYQRLDWLDRASSLSYLMNDDSMNTSKEQDLRNPGKLRSGLSNVVSADQIAVIELLMPSVFRAVISLHTAGSTSPDAVAFFSPNEGGSYLHARGLSIYHVFRHITEHANKALQFFLSVDTDIMLSLLLHWICSYQTLFTKVCSKCERLLMMEKSISLILPPVHRPYLDISAVLSIPNPVVRSTKGPATDVAPAYHAYHISCSSDEA